MRKLGLGLGLMLGLAGSAWADPPQACLTREELQAVVDSAVAQYRAGEALQKVGKAFAPQAQAVPAAKPK